MLNKSNLVEEILAVVAPNGEEESGIYRWQIALMLPNIVRKMVVDIATGIYPVLINPEKNKGLTGNNQDISVLQSQLQRLFVIPIAGTDGETTLAPALSDAQPMLLMLPFGKVTHPDIKSKLSMYVPDEDTLEELGKIYLDEAIVYTTDSFPFNQANAPTETVGGVATGGTDITNSKKMLYRPLGLTGSFEVLAYYVPTVENLPDVFKPFILQQAVMQLAGIRNERK